MVRQIGARGLDERDRRQPIALGDVIEAPTSTGESRTRALDRRVVRADHALDTGDSPDSADEPAPVVTRQRPCRRVAELEKITNPDEQHSIALARSAPRCPAALRLRRPSPAPIGAGGGRAAVDQGGRGARLPGERDRPAADQDS